MRLQILISNSVTIQFTKNWHSSRKINRFNKNGIRSSSEKRRKRGGPPLDPLNQQQAISSFHQNIKLSFKVASMELDVSQTTIFLTTKQVGLKIYKSIRGHELDRSSMEKQVAFPVLLNADCPAFEKYILWTHEW